MTGGWALTYCSFNTYVQKEQYAMPRMTTSELKKELGEVINRVLYKGERVELERRGKSVAAIVPFDDLKLIEEIEDAILAEKAGKALKGKGGIHLDQLRKKYQR